MSTVHPARRRRPWLVWVLVVLFVVVPLVEIWTIIQVGQAVGPWWTILLLVLDSILGSWLIKHEGSRAFRALREALGSGRMPARELADGALILIGGTLMLSPGFATDAVGILMILPFTRPLFRTALTRIVASRLTVMGAPSTGFGGMGGLGGGGLGGGFPGGFPGGPRERPGPGATGAGPVVPGEVVDDGRDHPHR